MSHRVSKVNVWSGEIEDRPGAVSDVFGTLARAGANLRFVFARRQPDRPGQGLLFVEPMQGKREEDAARSANLSPASDLVGILVEGSNKPGTGQRLTQVLAEEQINLRALSAMVIGSKFIALLAFDNAADADRGMKVLRKVH